MIMSHTMDDQFRRDAAPTFVEYGSLEMLAFGLDADPDEPPAVQPLRSEDWAITCYFRGGGTLRDRGGERRFAAGDVVLRVPQLAQRVEHDSEPRYAKAYCAVPAAHGAALRALGLLPREATTWRCGDLARALRVHQRILRELRGDPRPVGPAAWLLVVEWLQAVLPRPPRSGDELVIAAERLSVDLTAVLDLGGVARAAGMPYHTFRRRFRARFGLAPSAWRLRERMRRACLLLADHSVQAVAERLGYASPFAFSTQFSRSIGRSPSDWRRSLRG